MMYILMKYFITAGVVVVVSEISKRSDRLGGLVAALPMVTILTLCWLYFEKQPILKISNHAWYTLWYVIPTLPMFIVFPITLPKIGFWPSLGISALVTIVSFVLFSKFIKLFGIELM